jgi:hypothetical protein
MTILSLARTLLSPLTRWTQRLTMRRKGAPFSPATFAEMRRRKQEMFGDHADRTHCSCPHCRHWRKRVG